MIDKFRKDRTMELEYYKNRKVLITGHTGFKGSWLTKILLMAGAEVCGIALDPPTTPSLFEELHLKEALKERSVICDVRDLQKMQEVFASFKPEIVIHLAAQPIVRESYKDPVTTYSTNVMGTVNLLECVRNTPSVRSVLNVTTDKVYENKETDQAYKEDDRLDGYDPYSNSKSCSELVTHSYKLSFLNEMDIPVSTARAGNVIGGGDYAKDRIIPDCIRAVEQGLPVVLRNPRSIRPYQHVLEPLFVYLTIVMEQEKDHSLAGNYNVGPDKRDCVETGVLAGFFCDAWKEQASWTSQNDNGPHEANFLKLDNSKIKEVFGWHPVWDARTAVQKVVEYAKSPDKEKTVEEQIRTFIRDRK